MKQQVLYPLIEWAMPFVLVLTLTFIIVLVRFLIIELGLRRANLLDLVSFSGGARYQAPAAMILGLVGALMVNGWLYRIVYLLNRGHADVSEDVLSWISIPRIGIALEAIALMWLTRLYSPKAWGHASWIWPTIVAIIVTSAAAYLLA